MCFHLQVLAAVKRDRIIFSALLVAALSALVLGAKVILRASL